MADTDALIERLREAIPKLSSHQARTVGWLLDHTALLREAAAALAALTRERDDAIAAFNVECEETNRFEARAEAAEAALAQARRECEAMHRTAQAALLRSDSGPHEFWRGRAGAFVDARAALTGEAT